MKLKGKTRSGNILEFEVNDGMVNCDAKDLCEILFVPDTLKYLNCSTNHLTHLPHIPQLIGLHCEFNQLIKLPAYENLITLSCSYNQLIELPLLWKLQNLSCNGNNFDKDIDCHIYKTIIRNIDNVKTLEL